MEEGRTGIQSRLQSSIKTSNIKNVLQLKSHPTRLFVCLFVGIKLEKLYSASFSWREVKPLGMITHGLRHFYVSETKTTAQTTYLSINA